MQLSCRVGVDAGPADIVRAGEHRLPDDPDTDLGAAVEQGDDLAGLHGDLAQGRLAVKLLAPGQEPAFECFIGLGHRSSFGSLVFGLIGYQVSLVTTPVRRRSPRRRTCLVCHFLTACPSKQ